MPNRLPRQRTTLPCDSPPCLLSSTMAAWASGPSWEAAAPRASEVCSGCRPCRRRWQRRQRPTWTLNWRWIGRRGISTWYWKATWVSWTGPPQSGQASGSGASWTSSICSGGGGRRWALGAVVLARLAAGLLGLVCGLALGEGGGLALAGAGRLVELATEALVLGVQVAEASLKGLAAGTRDGLHAFIIGEVRAAAAPPS